LALGVREAPVGGGAEAAHLARDRRAGLLLPLPDAPDESVAAEVAPALALAFELPLDDDLGCDSRVIRADDPVCIVAAQAVVADQSVHQGLLERVPHVQRAGDVGRRQLDAVGSARRSAGLCEVAARLPDGVPALLDLVRVKALCEFHLQVETK